jgi:lipoprotein-releasing system ATP-binding protein
VLKGISFSIRQGDSLLIVGPSGAGKSTLLHILGLLDSPTRGEVWLGEQNLSALSSWKQARLRNEVFGFVFQFFHLMPDFSALENVMMPAIVGASAWAWPGRRKAIRERATELLERLGLKDRLRHRPSKLSGGERQRVAICRALVNQPRVLLLDEPTGNLDSKTGAQILDLVQELNKRDGQTLAMVTHAPDAAPWASRTLHLRDGELVH